MDEETFDAQAIEQMFSSLSMFNEKKLAVIENIFGNKEAEKDILEFCKNHAIADSEDLFLMVSQIIFLAGDDKKDKKILSDFEKNELYSYLEKHSRKMEQLNFMQGAALRAWAVKEFQKRNTAIASGALEFLLANIPNDSWLLENEIEKLSLYSKNITLSDVQLLIPQYFSPEIFTTVDALARKEKKRALELLHQHLAHGDDPFYLFSMLNFQLRNLYLLKLAEQKKISASGSLLGMHPFVFQKTKTQARYFSLEELSSMYEKLFEADLDIKTCKVDAGTALDLFVASAFS
jgi:DNA polymerase-3 subunit delta